jgi:hypothetical protein
MKSPKTILLIGCLVYWGVCLTPNAKAGQWDQKTVLTFSQPVEIPGLVLPAGTYVFSFLGSTADRNFIEVLSQDEQMVYATIEAIPDYRPNAVGETSIVYEQRKAGAPHAIKEWFFPDRRYGHEFVYPEMGALELGKAEQSANIPAESAERQSREAQSTKNEPEVTQPEETSYLRLLRQRQTKAPELAKADEPESADKSAGSAELTYLQLLHQKQLEALPQSAMVSELPRTASSLPLVGLLGILLLAATFGLRLYSKRID